MYQMVNRKAYMVHVRETVQLECLLLGIISNIMCCLCLISVMNAQLTWRPIPIGKNERQYFYFNINIAPLSSVFILIKCFI